MEKIKNAIQKLLRECRRLSDFFPIAVCLSITVTLAGYAVSMFILNNPVVKSFLQSLVYSESMYLFLENYASFIGIWIVILLVVAISPRNLPMLDAIKHNKRGNNIKGLLVGVVLGFCTNGFCVLMSVLTGDVKLSYFGFDFVVLLAFAIAVFIQSGAEELSDRFYLYQKLRRRYKHPAFAIIINSLSFTLLHVGNPGFTLIAGTQIFLVGLIFSLMVYYYNNLWGA
ncbi:MAG: CPBP family intramembrane metalloprotease, partial [Erysipelotrichaceae bacterium]|nr:CPBP family intramembrane metalloprotease [Erysipelotrichaceae bacterium]